MVNGEIHMITDDKNKDLLHGVTLEMILNYLVEKYGWEEMAGRIRINCFAKDPSIKSSLKFLRRTPWARSKVECLYLTAVKCRDLSRHTTDGSGF